MSSCPVRTADEGSQAASMDAAGSDDALGYSGIDRERQSDADGELARILSLRHLELDDAVGCRHQRARNNAHAATGFGCMIVRWLLCVIHGSRIGILCVVMMRMRVAG